MSFTIRAVLAALVAPLCAALFACGGGDDSGLTDRFLVTRNEGIAELDLATDDERLLIEVPDESLLIEPALSPDGETIAYVRQLVPIVVPGEPTELGMDLYLANRDGGNQHVLLAHSQPNEQVRAPVWFPDGERLLINVQRIAGGQIDSSLEILNVTSGQRTVVVDDGFRPALSADGTRVAYVTQDEQILQTLWVANVDGSDPVAVAGPDDELGSVISPRFSPDGETIAFAGSNLPAASVAGEDQPLTVAAASFRPGAASRPALKYNGLPADVWTVGSSGGALTNVAPLQLDLPSLDYSADGERLFVFAGLGFYVIHTADGTSELIGEGTFHGQMDWIGAGES